MLIKSKSIFTNGVVVSKAVAIVAVLINIDTVVIFINKRGNSVCTGGSEATIVLFSFLARTIKYLVFGVLPFLN